jgi:hypothetical protein
LLASSNYDTHLSTGGHSITLTGTDLDGATVVYDPGGANETTATVTGNTSTTVTFTTPNITPGTYDVVVTTSGGTSNPLTIEALSIAASTPSLWCSASYPGSPWPSSDASSLNLHHATPATVGTTPLNGFDPADFNGTNQQLVSYNTAASATVNASAIISTGGGTLYAFANIRTANAFASVQGQKALITRQASNGLGLTYSSSGLRAYVYDGSTKEPGSAIAFSTGVPQGFHMRWDGTNMYQGVAAGTETSVATTGPSTLTSPMVVGRGHTNTLAFYSDSLVYEVLMFSSCLSLATLGKFEKAFRCKYAL